MSTVVSALAERFARNFARNARILAIAACGLFCAWSVGHFMWLRAGPGSWGPRLACAEPRFDCGDVPVGGEVEHAFTITNAGRQPLHIHEAVSACGGCLSVEVSRNEVPPGENCTLIVVLHSARLKKGPFVKAILVTTDDPQSPKVMVYVQGTAV